MQVCQQFQGVTRNLGVCDAEILQSWEFAAQEGFYALVVDWCVGQLEFLQLWVGPVCHILDGIGGQSLVLSN